LLSELTLAPTKPVWDYWCDPIDVETFAQTGMGGAHFGEFEASDGQRPVVMIAPAGFDRPCIILGASLHEFLCLGCEVGYGLLVEMPARPAWTTDQIQKGTPPNHAEETQLLTKLRARFSLWPWEKVGARLFELQELYLDELDMPDR
jgi:hypothetical protein